MRLAEVKETSWKRLKHPATLVLVLGFIALPLGVIWLIPNPKRTPLDAIGFICMIGLLLFAAVASAAPWQWTGDERPLARWYRGLIQSAIYALGFGLIEALSITPFSKKPSFTTFAIESLTTGLIFFILSAPVGLLLAKWDAMRKEAESAQEKASQTQWMSQRGSFSPKLLFENLAHLSQIAAQDPKGTEKGLEKLAHLYREWLVEASKPMIALGTEVHMLEQFLVLEKARWGDRLNIQAHFELENASSAIPPLLFLSLIEQTLTPSPILNCHLHYEISGTTSWLHLRFTIEGDIPEPGSQSIQAVQTRILTIYEQMGHIQIQPQENGWSLEMKIPKRPLEAVACS